MAEVMNSLFGVTPESLMSQRNNALQAQALQYAQLDPFQRATAGIYAGANQLGGAVGGMLGAQDPEMAKAASLQGIMQGADTTTPEGLTTLARTLAQQGFGQQAMQVMGKAQESTLAGAKVESERALTQQRLREKALADPVQKLVEGGNYDPASVAAYQKSNNLADLKFKTPIETKSEFERVLGSLNLSPEQERAAKQQWVNAKLSTDPSGFKALQSQLVSLQVQQKQMDLDTKQGKIEADKTMAIEKLSATETNVDTALTTADQALKLAPGSFAGAANQAVSSFIPWTDAKSLKNLVSSLNSEKVLQTLEQLKAQSRTGATGFGALTEKELQLILDKTRSLDPTDKMFKENLTIVMEGWKNIKSTVRSSREGLQGKQADPLGLRNK